jgi:hypothetical protein
LTIKTIEMHPAQVPRKLDISRARRSRLRAHRVLTRVGVGLADTVQAKAGDADSKIGGLRV